MANHVPIPSQAETEVQRDSRMDEARYRRRLTVGCNECNADDVRFWDGVIRFLDEVK